MTNDGKENIRHVTCTNHAARSDKELARVCPSKLSKRELEDLYFSLLENNTQLKKTINGQLDKIKVLTTKVHRMTVQKTPLGSQNKDCCASTKGILNEQKETIEDLKKANERLSERIRFLNMKLCSAKQFLKRSPTHSTSRCVKCLTPNASIKNSSMSALNTKESDAKLRTDAGSFQFLNKISSTISAAEMESTEVKDEPCHQNKCRTVMDELKQKIENLVEDLSKTHKQYSGRMRNLEEEMRELRGENSRVRALQVESKHRLEVEEKKAGELLHKLRDAEAQCENLATELQIEKSKVSELETELKSGDISSQVADALEKHLITMMVVPGHSETSRCDTEPEKERTAIRNSDDSGYADKFEDKKESPKIDENILDQIATLQAQLNNLKLSMKDGDNTGGHLISETVQSIGKSKSESNETYGVAGASSCLSIDIFEPSRLKAVENIDSYASISRQEGLLSLEDIKRSPKAGSVKMVQQINKLDPHKRSQIPSPLPIDVTRIPYFGENSNNLNSPNQSKKNTSFDKPSFENRDLVRETVENKRSNSINIDGNNTNVPNHNEEAFNENGYEKKRRISSLRGSNQDKNKDLSVSYDQNKTIVGSTITIVDLNKEEYQGNDIKKDIRTPCQHDSDPSAEFKFSERNFEKNKENSVNGVNYVSYLDVNGRERGSAVNTDRNKKAVELNETPNLKDKLATMNDGVHLQDIGPMGKTVESPGTSSGNSTYTVGGNPIQGNMRDATYQVENRNQDAAFQDRNGDDQNRLGPTAEGLTQKQNRMLQPVNTSTPDRQKTYNAEGSAEVTRSVSPDNTEHEISSLTDLPSEDKSPRNYISPGEEKATSTYTDSYADATTTDYGSLSLGEVPMIGAKKLSDLETRKKSTDPLAMSTTSNKMEEALRAISDELTRCREMLQGQLPAQKPHLRNNSSMTEETPIELRRTEGKARVGGASTPKCIFTIHVGTIVLSDQAVLCSRGKSLTLSWQFYNQTATMTRLLAGRVMNFDYSSEYDHKITDHFLHYLKFEELPIIICELENQEEAFASCALPLRDALLHTNRRVDMSLALPARIKSIHEMRPTAEKKSSDSNSIYDILKSKKWRRRTFTLNDCDLPLLGRLARCRQPTPFTTNAHDPKQCVMFSIVSEPPEDPVGLDSCEDIGFAYLYLGDLVAYSAGAELYTAIVAVRAAGQEKSVCGAIAVKIDGLRLLQRCVALSYSDRSFGCCE